MDLNATRFDVVDGVATLWLDRPHRANAWTGRMHAEYRWIMAELEDRDDVRAVIIAGTGDRFCVGGDSQALSDHAERGSYDRGITDEAASPGGGDRIDADFAWQLGYRHPIIAAVNGACAGIGLALVTFCDLRFVHPDAKLTTAAPKLGLPAEYGMTWTLPRLIGTTRAADILLSGRVFTGTESAEWGLWNTVSDDPLAAATEWARALATTTGPEAVRMTKQQLAADLLRHDPQASVDDSIRLMNVAMGTDEYAEGVAALVEKRPPNF
ncbi:enoyl-CoA hydratase-related protein [Ilumatobacter nonamiensis]|uniref:enoyl-CoA hydratase-related protein n=1 Tax=Ilumatobacter nonamiensis TaxID=467093 RepID=UPI000345EEFE|nr:enoyl-CoA hydratase-related protein [Ilumatobacter nonamiensis]